MCSLKMIEIRQGAVKCKGSRISIISITSLGLNFRRQNLNKEYHVKQSETIHIKGSKNKNQFNPHNLIAEDSLQHNSIKGKEQNKLAETCDRYQESSTVSHGSENDTSSESQTEQKENIAFVSKRMSNHVVKQV